MMAGESRTRSRSGHPVATPVRLSPGGAVTRSTVRGRTAPGAYPSPMPESKDSVIATLRDVAAASARARAAMSEAEGDILEGVRRLEAGAGVMETLSTSGVRAHREDLEAALRLVVTARHRFRVVMVAQCVEANMSARQISELWGFSRQRAAVLVQEAREYMRQSATA